MEGMKMGGWYNKDGKELPVEKAAELLQNPRYKRVAGTDLKDGRWLSTVWLGMNHRFGDRGRPLIFESMLFGGETNYESLGCWRYSTLEEAQSGHEELVRRLEVGEDPDAILL